MAVGPTALPCRKRGCVGRPAPRASLAVGAAGQRAKSQAGGDSRSPAPALSRPGQGSGPRSLVVLRAGCSVLLEGHLPCALPCGGVGGCHVPPAYITATWPSLMPTYTSTRRGQTCSQNARGSKEQSSQARQGPGPILHPRRAQRAPLFRAALAWQPWLLQAKADQRWSRVRLWGDRRGLLGWASSGWWLCCRVFARAAEQFRGAAEEGRVRRISPTWHDACSSCGVGALAGQGVGRALFSSCKLVGRHFSFC